LKHIDDGLEKHNHLKNLSNCHDFLFNTKSFFVCVVHIFLPDEAQVLTSPS